MGLFDFINNFGNNKKAEEQKAHQEMLDAQEKAASTKKLSAIYNAITNPNISHEQLVYDLKTHPVNLNSLANKKSLIDIALTNALAIIQSHTIAYEAVVKDHPEIITLTEHYRKRCDVLKREGGIAHTKAATFFCWAPFLQKLGIAQSSWKDHALDLNTLENIEAIKSKVPVDHKEFNNTMKKAQICYRYQKQNHAIKPENQQTHEELQRYYQDYTKVGNVRQTVKDSLSSLEEFKKETSMILDPKDFLDAINDKIFLEHTPWITLYKPTEEQFKSDLDWEGYIQRRREFEKFFSNFPPEKHIRSTHLNDDNDDYEEEMLPQFGRQNIENYKLNKIGYYNWQPEQKTAEKSDNFDHIQQMINQFNHQRIVDKQAEQEKELEKEKYYNRDKGIDFDMDR